MDVPAGTRRRRAGFGAMRVGAGALVLLAACGGGDAPGEGASEEVPAEAPTPAARDAGPGRFLGILTVEGRPEVALCSGTALPVDGPAILELLELHADLAPGMEPLEGVFVDVLGKLRDDGDGAWLEALEVRRAAWEGWGCRTDESAVVLGASGTEPFWGLTVADRTADWSTPEAGETLFHDGLFRLPRGGWGLEANTSSGETRLSVEIQAQGCRNEMSGAYSHLTVLVRIGGTDYRGCGFSGPETIQIP